MFDRKSGTTFAVLGRAFATKAIVYSIIIMIFRQRSKTVTPPGHAVFQSFSILNFTLSGDSCKVNFMWFLLISKKNTFFEQHRNIKNPQSLSAIPAGNYGFYLLLLNLLYETLLMSHVVCCFKPYIKDHQIILCTKNSEELSWKAYTEWKISFLQCDWCRHYHI